VTTLERKAERLGIRVPTAATLRRYGLTALAWLELLAAQGWACAICGERSRLWNTDHEHVPGWKHRPPEERVRYVRGVLCPHCNYQKAPSRMTVEQSERLTAYLRAYETRRDA
jgi:hypothetical protein